MRCTGLRKLCACSKTRWAKCKHPWYFSYKPRGGTRYRFSLDVEAERHIESKTEAELFATTIRNQINESTFVRAADRRKAAAAAPVVTPEGISVRKFADTYLDRVSKVRERNRRWTNDQHMFARICAVQLPDGSALGDKPLGAVTEDDLEAVLIDLRGRGRAASTRNQYVRLLKASMRWAVKKGYLRQHPISEDSTVIKRGKIAQRNRRLAPDVYDDHGRLMQAGEERRLLAAAGARLQNLILAALETCCRRGELLNLQWRDVSLERATLTVRAEHAKDGEARILPISSRLVAVLKMARSDPAGKKYGPDAYVFGELGKQVTTSKRAWETCVLKAHGHNPEWKGTALAPESRAALKAIDLHFHDLRHEGGSRLLEAGWPLHHVQEMLGHASIEQTSTYLNVRAGGLLESMRKSDDARNRGNLVANTAPNGTAAKTETEAAIAEQVTVN